MAVKQALFIRAPLARAAGAPGGYTATDDEAGAVTVGVDGANPARLGLEPVFPGRLTFKPSPGSAIPVDPSQPGTAGIAGDLYLQIAPSALRELARVLPDWRMPLLFGYLGVTVAPDFFTGAVLAALRKAKKRKTDAEICRAFASGTLSVDISPGRDRSGYAFPVLIPDALSRQATTTFMLGVRTALAARSPSLAEVPGDSIRSLPDFAPIPVAILYSRLRELPRWNDLAAKGHADHPLWAALDGLEGAVTPGRWRRLRLFALGERPKTAYPMQAFETMRARAAADSTILWEQPVPRLGELHRKRPDGEAFRLELRQGAVAVPMALDPADQRQPALDLSWPAPADVRSRGIDLTVEVPRFADPLAGLRKDPPEPSPSLEEGCYDSGGHCFDSRNQQIHPTELVLPTQVLLRGFGYGITAELDGAYDPRTAHAVREFQRESKTTSRLRQGAVVDAVVTYTGEITGRVDEATWREFLVWQTNLYRSINSYAADLAPREVADVAFATPDILRHRIVTSGGDEIGTVTQSNDVVRGLANIKGAALTSLVTQQGFAGQTWEKRAICEVAHNEAVVFEALNTWDDSFLSVGLFQWTLGRIGADKNGRPLDTPGELIAVCARLAPDDFQQLFGKWGLGMDPAMTGQDGAKAGWFTLDGKRVEGEPMKTPFRSFRWTARFFEACREMPFRRAQFENALARQGLVATTPLHPLAPGRGDLPASELLQSELLRALALDQHVNRPGEVRTALVACLDALLEPGGLITDDLSDSPLAAAGPTTWLTHAMAAAARRKHDKADPKLLAKAERQAVVDAQQSTLARLKADCRATNTPALADPTAGGLNRMTQAQHDVLVRMYRWRREQTGTMTEPGKRADRIEAGGHTGTLGNLSRVPGQFAS